MTEGQRSELAGALEEYRQSQWVDADRPEANTNLGWLASRMGNLEEAESHYRRAIELDPTFIPAYVNLADLYRARNRDAAGEELLQSALEDFPDSAELLHALGLTLVRLGRGQEALDRFARAAEVAPEQSRYAFVYGVALHDLGDRERALGVLERAHDRAPSDVEILTALVSYYHQEGDRVKTLEYAKKLIALQPESPELSQLIEQIEAA